MKDDKQVRASIIELLELVTIESPFAHDLIDNYRRRLIDRLMDNGKIDQDTADYLLG